MEFFQDVYIVKPGDNLSKIARSRGYDNPGPIAAFPPNQPLFVGPATPDLIRVGARLYLPWHPNLLKKLIVTCEEMIRQITEYARKLMEEQVRSREDLERFLILIDSINMAAQINVSIGALVAESTAEGGQLGSRQILAWLADHHAHMIAGDLVPLVVPAPEMPKKDFKFFLRHALGPWTPSFWASVYTACKERDIDIYLYGSEATTYKVSMQIKQQAELDINKLKARIGTANSQLKMPFYQKRI